MTVKKLRFSDKSPGIMTINIAEQKARCDLVIMYLCNNWIHLHLCMGLDIRNSSIFH